MSTVQAMILGAMLALTPSVLLMTWTLWRESKIPSPQPPEILVEHIEDMILDLQQYAARIHDPLSNPAELAARLELIRACKLVLAAAGYGFTVDNIYRNVTIEDNEGSENHD